MYVIPATPEYLYVSDEDFILLFELTIVAYGCVEDQESSHVLERTDIIAEPCCYDEKNSKAYDGVIVNSINLISKNPNANQLVHCVPCEGGLSSDPVFYMTRV